MREIEFRGKRIDNGEWVYGNLMQFEDRATFIFADERKGASTLTYAHFIINNMHAIDEKTLGSCIGREDEDEKTIFENDIVQVLLEHFPMGYYQEVEYVGVVKYDTDICAYYLDLIKPPALSGETIPKEIDGIKITREDPEDFDTRFYFDASVDSAAMTVIGNIHENTELLEVAE
ncbi:TPA: hypothetical protein IQB98_001060 [Listeria monocytogenes]|nr:hypothetical protein [Listeria monocytogenes]HAO6415411.1 hypothetical protein [Listeria monocytogenes]